MIKIYLLFDISISELFYLKYANEAWNLIY